MTDCMNAEMRDALPDLLNGNLSEADAAVLQDHIDGCADCRSEFALLREVKASAVLAPAINVNAIAAVVPRYAPLAAPAARSNLPGWTWKLAAAAAIVTAGVIGISRETQSPQATRAIARAAAPVVAQTPTVVDPKPAQIAAPKANATGNEGEPQVASLTVGGLQELSDSDIEQLLADLNGMEALPSAEPQSVTSTLDDSGIDQ